MSWKIHRGVLATMFKKLLPFLTKQSVCLLGSNNVIFRDDVESVICSFGPYSNVGVIYCSDIEYLPGEKWKCNPAMLKNVSGRKQPQVP